MTSDLSVAFHGSSTLLKIHSPDNGIFAKALFDIENSVLQLALPLLLCRVSMTIDEELVYRKIQEIIVRMGLDKKVY